MPLILITCIIVIFILVLLYRFFNKKTNKPLKIDHKSYDAKKLLELGEEFKKAMEKTISEAADKSEKELEQAKEKLAEAKNIVESAQQTKASLDNEK